MTNDELDHSSTTMHPVQHETQIDHAALLDEIRAIVREELAFARLPKHREPLLDTHEVAAWLNVSTRTVDYMIAAREIQPLWIRGARRFSAGSIDAYLRSSARLRRRRRRRK